MNGFILHFNYVTQRKAQTHSHKHTYTHTHKYTYTNTHMHTNIFLFSVFKKLSLCVCPLRSRKSFTGLNGLWYR